MSAARVNAPRRRTCSAEAVWLAAEIAAAGSVLPSKPDGVARLAGEVGVLDQSGAEARTTASRGPSGDSTGTTIATACRANGTPGPRRRVGSRRSARVDSRRRAALEHRIVELRQRERTGVRLEPADVEEQAGDHRVGQRRRRRRSAGDAQDRRRVGEAHAGAAAILRHQRRIEPVVLDRLPQLLWESAFLDRVDHVLGDRGLEDRARGGDQQIADLAHRSPNPRAMIPRRISVVPPWMV